MPRLIGAPSSSGGTISLTAYRIPRNVSKEFRRRADLLGLGIKLHTLRGIHATALLDAGIPVDLVAQRLGDDPAVLLRNYTKRKRSPAAKERFASTLTALAAGFLKPLLGARAMKTLHLDPSQHGLGSPSSVTDADWLGNNAAFTCPACSKVFLVSKYLNRGGRACPNCGKSRAYVTGSPNQQHGKARIESDE